MKIQIATAALVFASVPAFAQTTGVSNPEPAAITASDDTVTQTPAEPGRRPLTAKPQAGTPATTAPATSGEVYGAYVPYKGAAAATANVAEENTTAPNAPNMDGEIVTSVPEREGELREGTLLRVTMVDGVSTQNTQPGAKFTAQIVEPVEKQGRVIIPIGAVMEGQVTEVHSGRRMSGGALLHLEPRNITLPDGTQYVVHAQLIDTGRSDFKVDSEGSLKKREHPKETLAVMSLETGSAAVAGAMIGGGIGAVVGAGVGAGVGTVMWLKQDRQATLDKDTRLVFSLTTPMILTPLTTAAVSSTTGQ